ncbi:autotransporter outer membrane beta-barrel domain-containing protein [Niabella hibiscisoli]|uniref:hypothetical protein n=1 Tax=Niabella hibiscisoli TaxID=1825928 RepID=UPI001F115941|nr:hypothetical protein [Niabella hibiscisoli]MCH5720754.1 hypothetical protein [Niabella hibiscisoli]
MVYPNRVLITLLFLVLSQRVACQVVLTLQEANVIGSQNYDATFTTGQLAIPLTGILSTAWQTIPVQIRNSGNASLANGTSNFSAGNISFELANIGGITPGATGFVGTSAGAVNISSSFQTIFSPTAANSDAPTGAIAGRYRIARTILANTALIAGNYTGGNLIYNQPTSSIIQLLVGYRYITPSPVTLSLGIPYLNKWVTFATSFTKNYNNVSSFTTVADLDFNLTNFTVGHTEPSFIDIKAQGPITFTPNGGGATTTVPVNIVQAQGSGLVTTALSTTYAALNTTGLVVPTGNITTIPLTLKISAANVVQHFFKPGTYTFSIDLRTRNSGNTIADVKTLSFTVTTDVLSSIAVQGTPDVNFSYGSLADYQTTKSINMPNHLLITNNRNYEVYVKSSTANFTRNSIATTIPASIVQIENGTGESTVTGRTLSTTSQSIITNAGSTIGRQLSLKYTIPASQTLQFLGKQTGATPYILNVIYSFTSL